MPTDRVLIVDDEEPVRRSLRKALVREGLAIEEAASGEEALRLLAQSPFDLVLSDIRMRKVSGLDLLAEIKEQWPDVIVILLTGYASLESAIQALRQGANDYLLKPASIHEVRASVREGLAKRQEALRRQDLMLKLREGILELSGTRNGEPGPTASGETAGPQQEAPPSELLRVGELTVDLARYQVAIAGTPVELTATEFRLLVCLLDNPGRVLHYGELVARALGYECDPLEARQLIMPHVSNLRRKLRVRPDSPDLIKNVRGVGYSLSV